MGILTSDMKRIVAEQKLGFVATVCADGTPNLSPKGTMLLLDDDHIMFGDIRSPGTIANLKANNAMEINFVDPFARKGYRFKGRARLAESGSEEFNALAPRFAHFGELAKKINRVVILHITNAAQLITQDYDVGATVAVLRRHWRTHFESIQPKT